MSSAIEAVSSEALPLWIEAIGGVAVIAVGMIGWFVRLEVRQGYDAKALEAYKQANDNAIQDLKSAIKETNQNHVQLANHLMENLLEIKETLAKICATIKVNEK